MKNKISIVFFVIGVSAFAQTPPQEQQPTLRLNDVAIEKAALPGSSLEWTKIIARFTTTDKWTDGLMFSAIAVLGDGPTSRAVTGNVRYSNIPAGTHQAIFYLSPRAAARFGTPKFVQITAFQKDTEADSKEWKAPGASGDSSDWQKLNIYNNVLVSVVRTPWIILDYEKAPDIVSD